MTEKDEDDEDEEKIDRPPDWHKDWWAWHAGLALGPYWVPALNHRNAAENIRVVVDPRAWDDDDDDDSCLRRCVG